MGEVFKKDAVASMAVVEKKRPNPRGCVGILVQFFDWKRRLSRNKMYKKLLSSAELKQASKKFGGIERQSKLRLIALENSGGFPKKCNADAAAVDDEQTLEMDKPGVVARLMGLDSIPAASQGVNYKKISAPAKMQELRAQKLRKMGACERQQVKSFGSQTLQFVNVLPKSRKHYPKLPSPVRTPRNPCTFKLIGTAAKILEPGIQRSGLQCAITCLNGDSLLEKCDSSDKQPFVFSSKLSPLDGSVKRSKIGQDVFYQSIEERLQENYAVLTRHIDTGVGPQQEKNLMHSGSHPTEVPVSTNTHNRMWNPMRISQLRDRPPASANLINLGASIKRQTATTDGLNRLATGGFMRSSASHISRRMQCDKYQLEKKMINQECSSIPPGRKRRSGTTRTCKGGIESFGGSSTFQDELGTLLEQKTKELKCHGEELGVSETQKTTATILQDIILAFSPTSTQHDDSNHLDNSISSSFFKATPRTEVVSECKDRKPPSPHLDSAANPGKETSLGILKTVSETLCTLSSLNVYPNMDNDTEILLLNAEMILQSMNIPSSIERRGYSIQSLLIDELEALAANLCQKFGPTLGIRDEKEIHRMKRFGVDAILEYLSSRVGRYPFEGSKKPKLRADDLMMEVVDEIARWGELSVLTLGNMIDQQVSSSSSSVKWMELEIEAEEFAVQMGHDLFGSLLDDTVTDLCHGNNPCFKTWVEF